MKKILVVNKSFETGGIQSSMINMVNELVKYCQVDIFAYNPEGPMKERLNQNVNILPTSLRFKALGASFSQLLKEKNIAGILLKVLGSVWTKLFNNRLPISCAIRHHERLDGYDMAISFHQEQREKAVVSGFTRVVDKLTDAKQKIAWVHFDSSIIDLDKEYNEPFYQKMDKIVCVSKSLAEGFAKNNPSLSDKVDYCYNFLDYDAIMAKSSCGQEVSFSEDKFVCFSASRLAPEKALSRAIKAIAETLRENSDVVWYIGGDGSERENIEKVIKEENLEDSIILLGNLSNPYPYMKKADLLMNVSYHEAAPMVFFEAKALGVPVFATETSSARELLEGFDQAVICENSAEGIERAFKDLIKERKTGKEDTNLPASPMANERSLEKLLSYIGEKN